MFEEYEEKYNNLEIGSLVFIQIYRRIDDHAELKIQPLLVYKKRAMFDILCQLGDFKYCATIQQLYLSYEECLESYRAGMPESLKSLITGINK